MLYMLLQLIPYGINLTPPHCSVCSAQAQCQQTLYVNDCPIWIHYRKFSQSEYELNNRLLMLAEWQFAKSTYTCQHIDDMATNKLTCPPRRLKANVRASKRVITSIIKSTNLVHSEFSFKSGGHWALLCRNTLCIRYTSRFSSLKG